MVRLGLKLTLKNCHDVHSMIDEDQQIKFDFYDISIAVSGPKGLMVPVVRDACLLYTSPSPRD